MDFNLNEDQKLIQKTVRELVQKEFTPKAAEVDRTGKIPKSNFEKMAEIGLFGMTVPPPYGGSGAGLTSLLVATEEIATACASTAMCLGSQAITEQALLAFGTDSQKSKYLPPLAKGEKLASVGVTESSAGQDFAMLECKATGKEGAYVLNGSKLFICNAGESDINLILARTSDAPGVSGLSLLIVEKDTLGLSFGKTEEKLGIRGVPSREMIFKDCMIPRENLIGKESMGLPQLMGAGGIGVLVAGAISVGIARVAFQAALEYARERKAFGQTISNFEAIQFEIGNMKTSIDAARLLLYRAAESIATKQPNPTEIFSAKIHASEMAFDTTNKALQIYGGYGYTKDFPLERYFRDARAFMIYPFTTEIYRVLLGRVLLGLELPWEGMPPMGPLHKGPAHK